MDDITWITFNELCITLRITPGQAIRLIKSDKIKYISWGRNYRTQYRFVDPGDDARLRMQAVNEYDFDLPGFPVISAAEFAEIAGVSQNRIRRLVHLGHIKPVKMGGVNVYTARQVRDILLKREKRTPRDRKPLIRDLVNWFMRYYADEHAQSFTKKQTVEDDAIELQLRRMMRLPASQRSKTMRLFWLRISLGKTVAEALREQK